MANVNVVPRPTWLCAAVDCRSRGVCLSWCCPVCCSSPPCLAGFCCQLWLGGWCLTWTGRRSWGRPPPLFLTTVYRWCPLLAPVPFLLAASLVLFGAFHGQGPVSASLGWSFACPSSGLVSAFAGQGPTSGVGGVAPLTSWWWTPWLLFVDFPSWGVLPVSVGWSLGFPGGGLVVAGLCPPRLVSCWFS